MRCSFALAALVAVGAQARPQDTTAIQIISQISDGQIQAPPAPTGVVPAPSVSVPAVPTEVPSVSVPVVSESVVVPSVVPTEVVPTTAVPTVVVPIVPTGGNLSSTAEMSPTGNATFTSPSPSSSETSGVPSAPAGSGAATANMVSFGGLAAVIAAFAL